MDCAEKERTAKAMVGGSSINFSFDGLFFCIS